MPHHISIDSYAFLNQIFWLYLGNLHCSFECPLLRENRPQEIKSGTGCQGLHESSQPSIPFPPLLNNHAPPLERAGTLGIALYLNRILLFLTFPPPSEITSHPVSQASNPEALLALFISLPHIPSDITFYP